jgi:hypothetical protein
MIGDSTRQFRKLIFQKGQELRSLSYDTLLKLVDTPTEQVELSGRRGTIDLIIEPCSGERLRVVIQGFLHARLIPLVKSVELDGFYKHQNGTVSLMEHKEFYDYD